MKTDLHILDGSAWIYRSYHGSSLSYDEQGRPNNAFNTFTAMLRDYTFKYHPTHLVVALDATRESWRSEMFPAYKANRKPNPAELTAQLNRFPVFLDSINVPRLGKANYEADDIIGTVCKMFASNTCQVFIGSADKDLMQLIATDRVSMIRPKPFADWAQFELCGVEAVQAKFGVMPIHVVEVLALMGDATDGIPGVAGIGPKRASYLIQRFLNLENLYNDLPEVGQKYGFRIKGFLEIGKEAAFISRALATINCDVPLKVDMEDWKR